MNTPKSPVPTAPSERPERPPSRSEWKGAVRYGAPPAPTPVPTPAEVKRQREEHFALLAEPIIAGMARALRITERLPIHTDPMPQEIASVVVRAFRAQGWFAKTGLQPDEPTNTSDRRVYVSDVCLSCGGGGTVGTGPNESPCSDCAAGRSTDQELGR